MLFDAMYSEVSCPSGIMYLEKVVMVPAFTTRRQSSARQIVGSDDSVLAALSNTYIITVLFFILFTSLWNRIDILSVYFFKRRDDLFGEMQ